MSNIKKIRNRSESYQANIVEISCSYEVLDIFSDTDSIYKKLNPFAYNDHIAELEEQLRIQLWRIIEDNLTDRQKEVVKLYASGKTQIEIAKALGVNQSSITKCLAADTRIHFLNQTTTIAELWEIWKNNPSQIRDMFILSLNENTINIFKNNIVRIMQNEPKQLLSITSASGKKIRSSLDHKFFTPDGWLPIIDIVKNNKKITVYQDGSVSNEYIKFYEIQNQEITYDIEVVGPHHNFVANNIVVSNCLYGNVDYKNKDEKGKPITYGGVKLKLQKIVKEDKVVNEILEKIADLRENELF